MTSQTKKYIELSDILALHCECRQGDCRTSLTIPIKDAAGRVLAKCPKCGEPWVRFLEHSYEVLIDELLEKMKRLNEATLGCALALEVREERHDSIQK